MSQNQSVTLERELFQDKELLSNFISIGHHLLYNDITRLEESRIIGGAFNNLETIEKEIKSYSKITSVVVFKIGELLIVGKRLCQNQKIRFDKWIRGNFNFSYRCGKNYMNVFKFCFGFYEYALHIKPSILYKISSESFPNDLREFILCQGGIEKITNKEFKLLLEKHIKGGMECVSSN